MADGKRLPTMDELIERHAPLLYRYAYRLAGNPHEAEDITQQTFLLAQERRHQLREAEAARSWLIAIVRNVFLKSRRHQSQRRSLDDIDEPQVIDSNFDPSVDHEELQRALLELSEEFRSPLVLYYFEEFGYQEIADHMGVPIGTVMSRLSRAKAFLRKRLTAAAEETARSQADTGRSRVMESRKMTKVVP